MVNTLEPEIRRPPVTGVAIDVRRREPKYYIAKRRLLEIMALLEPGSAVPTERVLAAELGISRTTVRQASFDLVAEGKLVRRHGSGTYVAEPKMTWPLQLLSFTARAEAMGFTASTQLLAAQRIPAEAEVAERLAVKVGAPIYRIERLRLADDRPMAVEISHLSAIRFPQLTRYVRRESSLYGVLDLVYGVVPVSANEAISTVPAPPREAVLLGTDTGAPMLSTWRHSFDEFDQPIEWVISWCRGDRVNFVVHLVKR
jgi:GntR family transcriptional regulator